jgi:hypothetical protein
MAFFNYIEGILKVPYCADRVRVTHEGQCAEWQGEGEPTVGTCVRVYRSTADDMCGRLYAEPQQFPVWALCTCFARFKAEDCEDVCPECKRIGAFNAALTQKFEMGGGL